MGCNTDLEYYAGEDISFTLNFVRNGEVLDVHGYDIWFNASVTKGGEPTIHKTYTLTSGEGINGTYIFVLPAAKTGAFGTYYYDFQCKDRADLITVLGEGRLEVKKRFSLIADSL